MALASERASRHILGRYALYDEIASGGMALVHFGKQLGAAGFSRPVAIKRLHPQFARDPEFVSMFLDEARLAARVRHPNVVSTMDVVAMEGELVLVLEYVHGESLAGLVRGGGARGEPIPPAVAVSVVCGALYGLHAAHEAKSEAGEPLCIVHRDVSPQNVLVGVDGVARVLDFGVATAAVRSQTTREGQLKGKLKYMAPEQLRGAPVTRTADVYSAGVVLWEALTGERLFTGESEAALFGKVLEGVVRAPSNVLPSLPRALDAVVLRARDPAERFATAREMAAELEAALTPASARDVGEWVERTAGPELAERAACIARIEAGEEPPMSRPPPRSSVRAPGHTRTATHTETANGTVQAPLTSPPSVSAVLQARAPASEPVVAPAAATTREPTAALVAPTPPASRWPFVGVVSALVIAAAIAFASRRTTVVLAEARSGVGAAVTQEATIAAVTTEQGPVDPARPPPTAAPGRFPHGRLVPGARSTASSPSASAAPTPTADPRPRPNCDPPYYEDASGIRRVKRECLQ